VNSTEQKVLRFLSQLRPRIPPPGFLGINLSLLRLDFFLFYKMLFMNRLEISCFPDFLYSFFKVEYGLL
jgi:hypothetical protein